MPPRVNAKKAKKARARAKTNASVDVEKSAFDAHESVAAAVLAHVSSVRDRLALACVSRAWRKVVTSEGAWGTCDLVLDSELGRRLTDKRFLRLLRYCGEVKRLEVRDAPATFKAEAFHFRHLKSVLPKFSPSLTDVRLTGCSGVTGERVFNFLGVPGFLLDKPKERRLQSLHLAGCDVRLDYFQYMIHAVADPPYCLSADNRESLLAANRLDLAPCWNCESVQAVRDFDICAACRVYLCQCEVADSHSCDFCGEVMCNGCAVEGGTNTYACEVCRKAFVWCGACRSTFFVCCEDECQKQTCFECVEAAGDGGYYVFCFFCEKMWCASCDPGVNIDIGTLECSGEKPRSISHCPACFEKAGKPEDVIGCNWRERYG